MTSVVTGRSICVHVVLFMYVFTYETMVVDGNSELIIIMVIAPARHFAYFGGGAPSTG